SQVILVIQIQGPVGVQIQLIAHTGMRCIVSPGSLVTDIAIAVEHITTMPVPTGMTDMQRPLRIQPGKLTLQPVITAQYPAAIIMAVATATNTARIKSIVSHVAALAGFDECDQSSSRGVIDRLLCQPQHEIDTV